MACGVLCTPFLQIMSCFCAYWPEVGDPKKHILTVTQQGAARFNITVYTQTYPPGVLPVHGQCMISTIALIAVESQEQQLSTWY